MILQIAYFSIFGKPLIMYAGILTLILLLLTATVSVLNAKGIRIIKFKWHKRLALITIIVALLHGILGLLIYF